MQRTLIRANFCSCQKVPPMKMLDLGMTWLKLAMAVENGFPFEHEDETISWRIHILSAQAMIAKPNLIMRSDLDKPVPKKFGEGSIIPQACCPDVISINKDLCGFINEKHMAPEKLAKKIVAILKKTRK